MTTRVETLNRALVRIGARPIQDETDPLAVTHLAVYDQVLERLAAYPFSYFKATRRLVRIAGTPDPAHYAFQFQLPADRIGGLRAVYPEPDLRRPTTDFEIEGDTLLSDHEALWSTFPFLSLPTRWPGDFRELFSTALRAELALSVREDRPLHDRLYMKAFGTPSEGGRGGLFAVAAEADAQTQPEDAVGGGENPLLDARWS